jgi:hypothetical protein
MPLRRRGVSKDVMERYADDEQLAGTYQDALKAATEAEDALRHAQSEDRSERELRTFSIALDRALVQALRAAEAAERVAMGRATYSPETGNPKSDIARREAEIAHRKAKARPDVRGWTDEADRLRTARERNLLSFRAAARSLT